MTTPIRKKLIEVALPLEAINAGCQQEKNPFLKGHPRSLHLWWARRPLAACRAVLFASLVDDPSAHPDKFPTDQAQEAERQRLFRLIEEMVKWENINNERVLKLAREEILKSTNGKPPPVYDPFCGGGSIPLEAQRLGLEAHGSDLNPVAALITKALIEIPPKYANRPPVNPKSRGLLESTPKVKDSDDHGPAGAGVAARLRPKPPTLTGQAAARIPSKPEAQTWKGASGLAEDIRYYGQWMRDEAEKRIGHLYPKVKLPKQHGGGEADVVAWIWARTVKCPNPACSCTMPLARSFMLSTRKGKEVRVEPRLDKNRSLSFHVVAGGKGVPDGTVRDRAVHCLFCGSVSEFNYIRSEAQAGRMGTTLLAVVAAGQKGPIYIAPDVFHEETARSAKPEWQPDERVTKPSHDVDRLPMYGMPTWGDAFSPRQLVAMTTFCELVHEAWKRARQDALAAGMSDACVSICDGGMGATAYADAVSVYLAFGISQLARYSCTLTTWNSTNQNVAQAFGRQALRMAWDFAECNTIRGVLDISSTVDWVASALKDLPASTPGYSEQCDAIEMRKSKPGVVATDPPYYDNIGYSNLSDFFYVWLRRCLSARLPSLFATVLTPKSQELVVAADRFDGDRDKAKQHFLHGLRKSFVQIHLAQDCEYPMSVYYAFKQTEEDHNSKSVSNQATLSSTGWETMLEGLLNAGFTIRGTWPIRTEREKGLKGSINALASSIVLVCRMRPADAPQTTRAAFLSALKRDLPVALHHLQQGNIAPVDLAQAAIGPGMAIYSQYSKVIEAAGNTMSVRTALTLINQTLDEVLTEQESEFDADTRFAITWFEQHGHEDGLFGNADVLARAKDTAVQGLVEGGIVNARAGKVRLLRRDELDADWDPATDERLTVWEMTQHLIRALKERGEAGTGELLRKIGAKGEVARDLAYRLFQVCERKKWASEAIDYNSLVIAWPEITKLARTAPAAPTAKQQEF